MFTKGFITAIAAVGGAVLVGAVMATPANAVSGTSHGVGHPGRSVEEAADPSGSGATARGGFASRPVGSFSWSWKGATINVPAGCFLNLSVRGSGLSLTGTTAGVDCIGPAAIIPGMFCNWSGRYQFKDTSNRVYATETTAVRSGCGQASFHIPGAKKRTMRTGSICLQFRNNGVVRGTTCMAVFK
ncbi:hypothetical protein [Curtobacterium sp. DN_7.5]|uniref:hypothetical protein n=1 Tax=Curtobacterium sp. DN_7.5 TaxID=3049047 RepID=UPI001F59C4B5|nr:hypothetical protein [Curtobacterium sp. DN_7.5]